MKAVELAKKPAETKNAIKGLQNVQGSLNSFGVELFDDGKYAGAYKLFNANLDAHKVIEESGELIKHC